MGFFKGESVPVMTCLQPATDAVPHLVNPGCAKDFDRSLERQAVDAVIFEAALMVGMSFLITSPVN